MFRIMSLSSGTDYVHPERAFFKNPKLFGLIFFSGAHSWGALGGGTNKWTATEGSLRTYCSTPYTGL